MSICRYFFATLVQTRTLSGFAFGTLAVNVVGCILIGVIALHVLNMQTDVMERAALITGFCGGFTTFSTFSYETIGLVTGGEWLKAGLYVFSSVAACLVGTAIGMRRLGP